MPYIHDNEITSYVVDLERHHITLYTKHLHQELQVNEEKIIKFQNVNSHLFENISQQNILLDINEYSIEDFVKENKEFLEERKKYSFPIDYSTEENLIEKLNSMNQKYFTINSSNGLSGWILAENMKIDTEIIDYESILNKHIIVGITFEDNNKNILKQIQFHGFVLSANKATGITIKREDTKKEFTLPPDLTSIKKAARGEYELISTGETVVNPDLLSSWRIIQDENQNS
jgi:hypothetical protein